MPKAPSSIEFAIKLLKAVRDAEAGITQPLIKETSEELGIKAWGFLEEEARRNKEKWERIQRLGKTVRVMHEQRKDVLDHALSPKYNHTYGISPIQTIAIPVLEGRLVGSWDCFNIHNDWIHDCGLVLTKMNMVMAGIEYPVCPRCQPEFQWVWFYRDCML